MTGEAAGGRAVASVPRTVDVLRAQLRLVARGHALAFALLALALAAGIGALAWLWPEGSASRLTLAVAVERTSGALQLVAVFWAAMVTWRGEGPGERFHHWSQPVDRRRHQLLRTAAGGAWLVGAVVAGTLAGWVAGALVQGGMPPGGPAPAAAAVGSFLLVYLLGTLPALVSEHPVAWIVGTYAGTGFLITIASARDWPLAGAARSLLLTGEWSLSAAADAPRLLASGGAGGSAWGALALWLGIAAAAVVAVAGVHQERSGSG